MSKEGEELMVGPFVCGEKGSFFGLVLPKEKLLQLLHCCSKHLVFELKDQSEEDMLIFRFGEPTVGGVFSNEEDYFLRKIFITRKEDCEIIQDINDLMASVRSMTNKFQRDFIRIKGDIQASYIYFQGDYDLTSSSMGFYTKQAIKFFERLEL